MSHFRGASRDTPPTESDRLLAMAVDLYESDLCKGCGQPRTYSMDPDSRGHYHAPDPAGCNGCRELQRAQKSAKGDSNGHLYWHVEPDDALVSAMEAGPVRDDALTTFLARVGASSAVDAPADEAESQQAKQ